MTANMTISCNSAWVKMDLYSSFVNINLTIAFVASGILADQIGEEHHRNMRSLRNIFQVPFFGLGPLCAILF